MDNFELMNKVCDFFTEKDVFSERIMGFFSEKEYEMMKEYISKGYDGFHINYGEYKNLEGEDLYLFLIKKFVIVATLEVVNSDSDYYDLKYLAERFLKN